MSKEDLAKKLAQLTRQWNVKQPHAKAPKPKPVYLQPGSLEAKVASSPYAAMLASPLRKCGIIQRVFPNQLLLRFAKGLHPETLEHIVYATVERKPQGGKGAYVFLRKSLVDAIKRGEYRAAIRSQAKYRQDMADYVQKKLYMYASDCFNQVEAKSLCIPLEPEDAAKSWICDKQIQCILRFQKGPFCELDHRIDISNEPIPCYDATQLWSKEMVDSIKNKYNDAPAIGVVKSFETVDLAIALWRCRQYNNNTGSAN